MQILPYWAKGSFSDLDGTGKRRTFSVWGWSFESRQGAAEGVAHDLSFSVLLQFD